MIGWTVWHLKTGPEDLEVERSLIFQGTEAEAIEEYDRLRCESSRSGYLVVDQDGIYMYANGNGDRD